MSRSDTTGTANSYVTSDGRRRQVTETYMDGQTVPNTRGFHQMMQQLLAEGKVNVVRGDDGTNTVAIPRELLPPEIQAALPQDGEEPYQQYVDGPTGRIVHDTRHTGVRAELQCTDPPIVARDGTTVHRIEVMEPSQGKNGCEPRIETYADRSNYEYEGVCGARENLARTFLDCSIMSAWHALSTPGKSPEEQEEIATNRERKFEWLALGVDDDGKTHKRLCELRLQVQDGCALDGHGLFGVGLRKRDGVDFVDCMHAVQSLHKGAREQFVHYVEEWECYSHLGQPRGPGTLDDWERRHFEESLLRAGPRNCRQDQLRQLRQFAKEPSEDLLEQVDELLMPFIDQYFYTRRNQQGNIIIPWDELAINVNRPFASTLKRRPEFQWSLNKALVDCVKRANDDLRKIAVQAGCPDIVGYALNNFQTPVVMRDNSSPTPRCKAWHPYEGVKILDGAAAMETYIKMSNFQTDTSTSGKTIVQLIVPEGRLAQFMFGDMRRHASPVPMATDLHPHWDTRKVAAQEAQMRNRLAERKEMEELGRVEARAERKRMSEERERIERERVERERQLARQRLHERAEAARVRKLAQEEAERRAAAIKILVSNTVACAINSMPAMREARAHDVQMAERFREARERAHDELEGDRALAAAVAEEVARMRQEQRDREEAAIARARANNAEVRRKAVDRERVLKERRDWARAEKAREKAERLAEQQKAAEAAAVAAAREADRIKKAAWNAQREAAKAAHRANNAPKLSSKNLGKLPQGRALSSTDDDSSSVAASQAVSMAPSIRKPYNASEITLPRMTGHASVQKHREGKPRGLTEVQWQQRKRDCLTAPDRKWVQYDALTGDPTTVVQKDDLKLYLSRDGAVIKTVVWVPRKAQCDSDESSVTSEAGPSSSSASPVQTPAEPTPSRDFAKIVEERHIAEAIRRSLADMGVGA